MASQTDICNIAAILLGQSPIVAISDTGTVAKAFNAVWNTIRDSELRKHLWRFSIQRAQLPALATDPVNGPYNTQFELPADCLRVIQVGDSNFNYPGVDLSDYRSGPTNDDYVIEGNMVLSNLGAPLSLRYVQQVTDTTAWDACFGEAMGARMASVCCFKVTNSLNLVKLATGAYQQAIRDGIRANAFETAPTMPADDTWVATRPAGGGGAANIRFG